MQAVDIAMETLATYINTERPSCNLNANGHGAIGPARGFVKAMLDMIRLWYSSSDHAVLVQHVWRVMAGVCWTPRHIQMIVDVLSWQKLMPNPPSAWSETANTVRPKTPIDDFDVILRSGLLIDPVIHDFSPGHLLLLPDSSTSSTAQGDGGSFKNRKPIGEVGCCESRMAKRIHWWTERWLRSPLFLSLSLTIYLPTYLSISLFISLFIYRSISLSLSLTCLSNYVSTYLPIYLSTYLSLCLSVSLSICLSASLKTKLCCETSSVCELDNIKNAAILKQFCETSSFFEVDNIKNETNTARLPSKMESWVQSWRPLTNAFCDFSSPPVGSTAPAMKKWCQVIRSAAPVTQNHLSKPENLMLQNATPLRKSAPGHPNSSDEHVSCTAPATENASLQILFECPTPAIVFRNGTRPSRFAHFWQGAQSLAPAKRNDTWTSKSGATMWCF